MEIMTIKNVRGYMDESGNAHMNLEDVARGLGFTETAASGNEVVRWARVKGYLAELGFIATSGDGETFIPENIFYRLAMKAKNETAEKFQAIVADEILPSIRKHGAYMTESTIQKALNSPDFLIQLATKLKDEQAARLEAESKLAIAQPKAETFTTIAEDEGFLLTAGEIAKTIALPGLNGQRVREILREEGILCMTKNEITADALRKGWGRMIIDTIDTGYKTIPASTPKFRGKTIDLVARIWKQRNLFQ